MVCRHNICRSPMAEGLMKHALRDVGLRWKVKVASAGTHVDLSGQRTDERARKVAAEHGVRLGKGRSRPIKPADFEKFDYIFAMDQENLANLLGICPEDKRYKVRLLMEFAGHGELSDVPDPYYGNFRGFENVFHLLEGAIEGVIQRKVLPVLSNSFTQV
ncbi:MAG: low molecular weight protein-tyrosine-phosphatase [Porticoccaceae bacterium]